MKPSLPNCFFINRSWHRQRNHLFCWPDPSEILVLDYIFLPLLLNLLLQSIENKHQQSHVSQLTLDLGQMRYSPGSGPYKWPFD